MSASFGPDPAGSFADRTVQLRIPEAFRQAHGTDAPDTAEPEAAEPAAPVRKPGRDRYLDLLRALALVRVILYHNFGWFWLPLVFPSMGVMFALAGSLMANSLKRPAWSVIRSRLRRLLPPMWLFGAIAVTAMIYDGWGPNASGHPGWWWGELSFWVLPLSEPPFGTGLHGLHHLVDPGWAEQISVPLWYLRAYLWYVLLSPLLLKALRKLPWVTLLLPIALSVLINSGLVDQEGRLMEAATDFTTFGACWLLGMAHHEGILKRLPRYVAPSIAPMILIAALWWLERAPSDNPAAGVDIEGVPVAQAVWSFGFVLMLLHLSPSWQQWPKPLERWNGLVSWLNARAVSVYLWHNVALVLSQPLIDQLWQVDFIYLHLRWLLMSQWLPLIVAIPLLVLFVTAFGWVEDVAARRSPRLFPWPRRVRSRRRA